jgi:hypothetical protein
MPEVRVGEGQCLGPFGSEKSTRSRRLWVTAGLVELPH